MSLSADYQYQQGRSRSRSLHPCTATHRRSPTRNCRSHAWPDRGVPPGKILQPCANAQFEELEVIRDRQTQVAFLRQGPLGVGCWWGRWRALSPLSGFCVSFGSVEPLDTSALLERATQEACLRRLGSRQRTRSERPRRRRSRRPRLRRSRPRQLKRLRRTRWIWRGSRVDRSKVHATHQRGHLPTLP